MNINMPGAQAIECDQFRPEQFISGKGKANTRIVIIAPLRVTAFPPGAPSHTSVGFGDNATESCKITFGCNLFKACHNSDCSYSLSHLPEKIRSEL
jgi:hypothetical protein